MSEGDGVSLTARATHVNRRHASIVLAASSGRHRARRDARGVTDERKAESGHARLTVGMHEAKVEFVNRTTEVIHEFRVYPTR